MDRVNSIAKKKLTIKKVIARLLSGFTKKKKYKSEIQKTTVNIKLNLTFFSATFLRLNFISFNSTCFADIIYKWFQNHLYRHI